MQKTFRALTLAAAFALPALISAVFSGCAGTPVYLASLDNKYGHTYAVVVSTETYAKPDWAEVADTLVRKHNGTLITYSGDTILTPLGNCQDELRRLMPRYTAFVATREERSGDYPVWVNLIVRDLDDDPYADTLFGIITGNNAEEALRLVSDLKTITLKMADAEAIAAEAKKENKIRIKTGDEIAQRIDTGAGNDTAKILDLWQTLPGRNSLAESFFFAMPETQNIIPIPGHPPPQVPRIFYGDPARKVVIKAEGDSFVTGGITSSGKTHTFTMRILNYDQAITNETPIGVIFTKRIANPKILTGLQYAPVLADNFILLKNPRPQSGEQEIVVTFEGTPVE